MRFLVIFSLFLALAPATVAFAQGGSPFSPLPQAPPPPTPTPEAQNRPGDGVTRQTMFLIAAGVIAMFAVGGFLLTRDARRSLTIEDREKLERPPADPEQVRRDRRAQEAARKKARDKARRSKAARKRTKRSR